MSTLTQLVLAGAGLATLLIGGHVWTQVKIDTALPVTGSASLLGDPGKRTLELKVDEINVTARVNDGN